MERGKVMPPRLSQDHEAQVDESNGGNCAIADRPPIRTPVRPSALRFGLDCQEIDWRRAVRSWPLSILLRPARYFPPRPLPLCGPNRSSAISNRHCGHKCRTGSRASARGSAEWLHYFRSMRLRRSSRVGRYFSQFGTNAIVGIGPKPPFGVIGLENSSRPLRALGSSNRPQINCAGGKRKSARRRICPRPAPTSR